MDAKINIGEVTVAEYNIIMKQLAMGQLGECIDLFMKLRQIGADFQQAQQAPQNVQTLTPPTK